MPPFAFHVTKSMTWRGNPEEFSNVYHYLMDPNPPQEEFESLADALVNSERQIHDTQVAYKTVRVHGPTDATKVEDQMRFVKDYTLMGSFLSGFITAKELTAVVQCYIGRGPKGGKQFIRKYFHSGRFPATSASDEELFGNASYESGELSMYKDHMDRVKNLTAGNGNTSALVSPQGKGLPLLATFEVLPYLHTRQFRR